VTAITAKTLLPWSNLAMKTRHFIFGVVAFAVTLSGAAFADGIYKWTDADGGVHYEDRPSGGPNDEYVQIASNRTNNANVQQRVQDRLDSQASNREAKDAATADAATAAEERAEIENKKKRCEQYRAKLNTMVQSQRLYREDKNGERIYLDEDQKRQAREHAETLIHQNCNT
jgi:hypothetical protein